MSAAGKPAAGRSAQQEKAEPSFQECGLQAIIALVELGSLGCHVSSVAALAVWGLRECVQGACPHCCSERVLSSKGFSDLSINPIPKSLHCT